MPPMSAPYPPQIQSLGGIPSIIPDVPIATVFIVLFLAGGAVHMKIFRANMKDGKKFIMSGMTFGMPSTFIRASSMAATRIPSIESGLTVL